jgi:hypothetical protein
MAKLETTSTGGTGGSSDGSSNGGASSAGGQREPRGQARLDLALRDLSRVEICRLGAGAAEQRSQHDTASGDLDTRARGRGQCPRVSSLE